MPVSNLEATLLYGIFMIFPVLPQKALKILGMLYIELMGGTVLEKNLNMQNKKSIKSPNCIKYAF